MNNIFPHVAIAIFFHGILVCLVCISPPLKKPPPLLPFKEKIVSLPLQLHASPSQHSSSLKLAQKTISEGPSQTLATAKARPLEKKQVSNIPPQQLTPALLPNSNIKENKRLSSVQLKTLSEVTETLTRHLDKNGTLFADVSLTSTPEFTHNSALLITQENELRELLHHYVVLPTQGEVRIKLVLTSSGTIQECTFLSTISEMDKQILTAQIQSVPFQNFLKKYKISKNISFHIKLISNEA
ncbi:inclusion-associated protein [Candidatus Chlamydia sanziniae]|uniref:Putative TolA protein n=1 Tax=Candidatus Chlamydia sanziniae TaxID=1806891 RepID=A0A1A9HX19_9CHLA|nr:inclusion-associated protein [Candidatus Chlamydia sanziniae]ANH78584.1 Putative TolA protein [Candidatus Chlamydia sanziniae]